MTTSVENAHKAASRKREGLVACRRARKSEDSSLYTGVDQIMQKFGIIRATYHDRDLNSGGIDNSMG